MWVRGLKHRTGIFGELYLVAPHVGAWIETDQDNRDRQSVTVAPHVGAWIETASKQRVVRFDRSHPMWVRGLKPPFHRCFVRRLLSHPMWVRGLKPPCWILRHPSNGRTPCGCVD